MTSLYLSSLKLSVISPSFGTPLFRAISLCVGVRDDNRLLSDIISDVDVDVLDSRFCGMDGGLIGREDSDNNVVVVSNARSRGDRLGCVSGVIVEEVVRSYTVVRSEGFAIDDRELFLVQPVDFGLDGVVIDLGLLTCLVGVFDQA